MFFGPGEPPSPEQIAEYEAQQEKARMEHDVFNNEIQAWLDSLGPRENFLLKSILVTAHGDQNYTARQIGEANGRMRYLHSVDPDTGLPEGVDFFGDADKGSGE
jgi:hypothetical protein